MAYIQTVRGRIAPDEMGLTYCHDHLIVRPPQPFATDDPDLYMDDVDVAIHELGLFRTAGGRAIVEMTTVDVGRAPEVLRQISETTAVHIIAATGYNKDKYCSNIVSAKSVDRIAQEMLQDLTIGINNTGIRAGVIKAATSKGLMTPAEELVFQAAITAHKQSGAPISTHTEAGTFALEQIDFLVSAGVEPSHIIIGHLDRRLDFEYHLAIAQTGVFLGYDQISKEQYGPDIQRIEFIKRLVEGGYARQILVSCDFARKSYWPSYNFGFGPGLTYILWRFIPWMLREGISEDAILTLLALNPANAFAWME